MLKNNNIYKYITMIAISAENINKTFYKDKLQTRALINFSVKIPSGSIFGLLGPNGAGKSTFINILAGLVNKDSGEIFIEGINADKETKLCKKKIGIVPQELNIDPFFTPYELLELQSGLYGVKKKYRKSKEILKRVNLWDQKDAYARTLSGGMRRRLLVAKALVHNPEIIILDEPTAGVDVELRQNLWSYIKELNDRGTTICLTTHYLEEAERLCDQITIINNGKILRSDFKDNLINIIGKKTVHFHLTDNLKFIPNILQSYNPSLNNNILSISYDKKQTKLRKILEKLNKLNIAFDEINTQESDLEDVFIQLTNMKK